MLYIMRHGRTDWNVERKLQGHTDVPLNEEGRQMAEEAAVRYKEVSIDTCYCSPLVRAKETAEIVLRDRNIPIWFDDRLVEMGFGEYEGIKLNTLAEDAPMYCFNTRKNMCRVLMESLLQNFIREPEAFSKRS